MDDSLSPAGLASLLQRVRIAPAAARLPPDVTQAQIEVLLARIALLTDALRDAGPGDTARLASQMLLADVALVAGQLRAAANAARVSVTASIDAADKALRTAIDSPAG